jgi:RNA polymerase sigma-70 factor (sigma-E family)
MTGNAALAEDLVQASLAHTWVRWNRIRSQAAAEVYVRRVMVTMFLGWRRRLWNKEYALGWIPDRQIQHDEFEDSLTRNALLSALRALPPHQRVVVALRYLDDLSESATAEILGCSVGTVKSQSARAMRALREVPDLHAAILGDEPDG